MTRRYSWPRYLGRRAGMGVMSFLGVRDVLGFVGCPRASNLGYSPFQHPPFTLKNVEKYV
jgi:hypothetical protein